MGEERLECLEQVPAVGMVVIQACGLGIRREVGVERPAAEGQQAQAPGEAASPPEPPLKGLGVRLQGPEVVFEGFDALSQGVHGGPPLLCGRWGRVSGGRRIARHTNAVWHRRKYRGGRERGQSPRYSNGATNSVTPHWPKEVLARGVDAVREGPPYTICRCDREARRRLSSAERVIAASRQVA
jgi:hypothetical protein